MPAPSPQFVDSNDDSSGNREMFMKIGWIGALAGATLFAQSGIEDTWQGTLDLGAIKLRLGLHVDENAQGEFSSKLDSIDQNALGIPVRVTTFSSGKLHLELPNLHATYDGTSAPAERR